MFANDTKILIVDDIPLMIANCEKMLQYMGFTNIEHASDGDVAFQMVEEASPPFGLIISDWNMPNLSGLEFLKKVRAHATLGKTPFIMLTTESEAADVMEAVKAGVSNYIAKPVTAEVLSQKLEAVHKKLFK